MANCLMGTYEHTMDAKGRMAFPTKLRERLGLSFIVTIGLDGCLYVYSNEDGEVLNVSISTEQKLVVDRMKAGKNDFSELFASGLFSVMSADSTKRGKVTLDLYFDRMMAEIFTDNGTVVNSTAVFPEKPYQTATLYGEGRLMIGAAKE